MSSEKQEVDTTKRENGGDLTTIEAKRALLQQYDEFIGRELMLRFGIQHSKIGSASLIEDFLKEIA
jgi:hypothetical protein